jgi:hypothetical protein
MRPGGRRGECRRNRILLLSGLLSHLILDLVLARARVNLVVR